MSQRDLKLRDFAKRLVQLSLDHDRCPCPDRVHAVIESIRHHPPRDLQAMLHFYRRFLEVELLRTIARVESATELSPARIAELEAHYSAQYGRKIRAEVTVNPRLIGGLRVQVGDDVYESSVAARLSRLALRSA